MSYLFSKSPVWIFACNTSRFVFRGPASHAFPFPEKDGQIWLTALAFLSGVRRQSAGFISTTPNKTAYEVLVCSTYILGLHRQQNLKHKIQLRDLHSQKFVAPVWNFYERLLLCHCLSPVDPRTDSGQPNYHLAPSDIYFLCFCHQGYVPEICLRIFYLV